MPESNIAAQVARLEKQLADLQARLPAHSIPPSMMAELDELEETLAQARRQWQEKGEGRGDPS
jgi:anti-sigma-K factor RskA